jgi:two-component system OmpR family sensor kinase
MNRSLRWRLQGWYAVVLLAVIGGFATLLYAQVRSARFQEIDATLTADALYLDTNLRRFPPHELDGGRPDGPPPDRRRVGFPPGPDEDGLEGRPPSNRDRPPDHSRPDRPGPPPGPPRPNRDQRLAELALPNRPGGVAPKETYFAIWRADGNLLKAADLPPDVTMPVLPNSAPPATIRLGWRGDFREATVLAPGATRVLVGRSVAQERAELTRFAWQLGAAGVAVLAIGLAGGWLASSRILRPIAGISATAAAISATNLSERIDPATVDRELEGLARVLNTTFDGLEAAFDRQARFTADASHELRTPLAAIRSVGEVGLQKDGSRAEYRDIIGSMLEEVNRLTSLVDNLLTISRADAGSLQLELVDVPVMQLVREAAALFEVLVEEKALNLIVTGDESATVEGDRLFLRQALVNLLHNAVKYSPLGGTISVRVQSSINEVAVDIEDNGPGIPLEDRQKIFDRFYRVDRARWRESGGAGLGLSITKWVVEAHGGKIGLESEWTEGCLFRVNLPLSKRTV